MSQSNAPRAASVALFAGCLLVAVMWVLITPPGAGADEPSHLTRSGAVISNQLDGRDLDVLSLESYELADRYQVPEPACYALDSWQPAWCAAWPPITGRNIELSSRADAYPPPGHALYGLASLTPGLLPIWSSRLLSTTLFAVVLATVLAQAARRSSRSAAGLLCAATPMVWGVCATVNPSALAITGAFGVWAFLLNSRRDTSGKLPAAAALLVALCWALLIATRRDGLVWASLILAVVHLATGVSSAQQLRKLHWAGQLVTVTTTLAMLAWALSNDDRVARLLIVTPLAPIAAALVRGLWNRTTTLPQRALVAAGTTALTTIGGAAAVHLSPVGWNVDVIGLILGQTTENLREAVGVLGWLDAPMPFAVHLVFAAAATLLVASAARNNASRSAWSIGTLLITIGASWVLELHQGGNDGMYWQGRYYLPLLIGVPLLSATTPTATRRRVWWWVSAALLAAMNFGAWAAVRRWAVGVEGTWNPLRWPTGLAPVNSLLPLAGMAASSCLIAVSLWWLDRHRFVTGEPDECSAPQPSSRIGSVS